MNKKEWQDLYNILFSIHSEFLESNRISRSGKNKKIRQEADRRVMSAIKHAEVEINKKPESMVFMADYSQYSYSEFFLPQYFGSDMDEFLGKIKEKIGMIEPLE